MKIGYIAVGSFNHKSGVEKKIYSQLTEWKKKGHEVKLFILSKKDINEAFKNLDAVLIKYTSNIELVLNLNLVREIKLWKPDIIYFRHYPFSLGIYNLIKRIPTIIEYNTNDVEEVKIIFNLPTKLFHMMTRDFYFKRTKGIVTVTHELKDFLTKYNKPTITIANGIDKKVTTPLRKQENSNINVIFIGSPNQDWHGIDKIYYMAQHMPEVKFHLIGIEGNEELSNVKAYGYLEQNAYQKIIEKCDVAIGTLALHRKGMNEASPLKVREYLNNKLPVLIAYEDTDFSNKNAEFLCKIPNSEKNVEKNITKIKEFFMKAKDIKIQDEDISSLYNEKKELKRLKFIEETYFNN